MMKLESVHELAEDLADRLGIYGCGDESVVHEDSCGCRFCFVIKMEDRIREAVENDKYLENR